MKNFLFISGIFIFFSFLFSGCHREAPEIRLKNGVYVGYFHYDTLTLWESVEIKGDQFEEYASGGIMLQKFPEITLTKGTYSIHGSKISFNNIRAAQPPLTGYPQLCPDCILQGTFTLESFSDSTFSFWRYDEKGKQEYKLTMQNVE